MKCAAVRAQISQREADGDRAALAAERAAAEEALSKAMAVVADRAAKLEVSMRTREQGSAALTRRARLLRRHLSRGKGWLGERQKPLSRTA